MIGSDGIYVSEKLRAARRDGMTDAKLENDDKNETINARKEALLAVGAALVAALAGLVAIFISLGHRY